MTAGRGPVSMGPDPLEERLLARMLFFTDAVFAIVLTLLVLELRPPPLGTDAALWAALREMRPHFAAFVMSFALVSVFWLAHMNTTRKMVRFDWPTTVVNLVFLLPVALMPFASALLGQRFGGVAIWQVYSWVMVAASALMVALVGVSTRDGGRLVEGGGPRERRYRAMRAASPGLAFGAGLGLIELGQPGAAHLCWLLIPPIFGLARWLFGPKPAAPSSPATP